MSFLARVTSPPSSRIFPFLESMIRFREARGRSDDHNGRETTRATTTGHMDFRYIQAEHSTVLEIDKCVCLDRQLAIIAEKRFNGL